MITNNEWNNVPAGTPSCELIWNTPCCNCGDCRRKNEKIQLTDNIRLDIEIYDSDNDYNLQLEFYDMNKRENIGELLLYSNDFDMGLNKFKALVNNILNCFEPVEFQNFVCLDDF